MGFWGFGGALTSLPNSTNSLIVSRENSTSIACISGVLFSLLTESTDSFPDLSKVRSSSSLLFVDICSYKSKTVFSLRMQIS